VITPERKRVAIVGIGNIARKVYMPLLSQHDHAEVVGVLSHSSTTVEQAVHTYRFPKGTTNLEELLSWDLDAVFVHSPTTTHYDIVTKCLERGISVYVDKPLSYDLEQSRRMAELAQDKGLLLGVGFNRRFAPMYVTAKQWLEEVGGISHCNAIKHRTKLQTGSSHETVYDDLIHMLDLLLWLCGDHYELLRSILHANGAGRLMQASGMLGWKQGAVGMYSMVRELVWIWRSLSCTETADRWKWWIWTRRFSMKRMHYRILKVLEAGIPCWIEEVSAE
jgi:virulence factor